MSMYKDYVEGQIDGNVRLVHETNKGFITYSMHDEMCQLEEVYVKPEFRRKGIAKELRDFAAKHAKELGCKFLKGSVIVGTNMAEESCMAILKDGYKFWYTDSLYIIFRKEL